MAIAFDATSEGSGTTSPVTLSHTCTGSNLILMVGITIYDADPGSPDVVTGVTYNGVPMTQIGKVAHTPDSEDYLYYLINPATGANNISVSLSKTVSACVIRGASYTGVKQSGQPDASNTGGPTATSLTTSVTTIADNCWLVGHCYNDSGGNASAGTGTTSRSSASQVIFIDSNGAKTPAGSYSLQTTSASGTLVNIIASISPVVTESSVVKPSSNLLLMGMG